jgi:FixJ family two-component response regulator
MAGDLEYAETTLKIHRARIMKIGARSLVDVSEWPRQVGRAKLDGAQT